MNKFMTFINVIGALALAVVTWTFVGIFSHNNDVYALGGFVMVAIPVSILLFIFLFMPMFIRQESKARLSILNRAIPWILFVILIAEWVVSFQLPSHGSGC